MSAPSGKLRRGAGDGPRPPLATVSAFARRPSPILDALEFLGLGPADGALLGGLLAGVHVAADVAFPALGHVGASLERGPFRRRGPGAGPSRRRAARGAMIGPRPGAVQGGVAPLTCGGRPPG